MNASGQWSLQAIDGAAVPGILEASVAAPVNASPMSELAAFLGRRT